MKNKTILITGGTTGIGLEREDIQTIFDRLDLDDYATFGGKG